MKQVKEWLDLSTKVAIPFIIFGVGIIVTQLNVLSVSVSELEVNLERRLTRIETTTLSYDREFIAVRALETRVAAIEGSRFTAKDASTELGIIKEQINEIKVRLEKKPDIDQLPPTPFVERVKRLESHVLELQKNIRGG